MAQEAGIADRPSISTHSASADLVESVSSYITKDGNLAPNHESRMAAWGRSAPPSRREAVLRLHRAEPRVCAFGVCLFHTPRSFSSVRCTQIPDASSEAARAPRRLQCARALSRSCSASRRSVASQPQPRRLRPSPVDTAHETALVTPRAKLSTSIESRHDTELQSVTAALRAPLYWDPHKSFKASAKC